MDFVSSIHWHVRFAKQTSKAMSRDTHLYFADAEFPRALWSEVLSLFEFEPREPHSKSFVSPAPHLTIAQWIVRFKFVAIWCSLRPAQGEFDFDAKWIIATDCAPGFIDALGVANLAYAALFWIPNTTFDDCDGHLCRTPDEFIEIYIPHLESQITSANFKQMFEAGIVDYDGKLRF